MTSFAKLDGRASLAHGRSSPIAGANAVAVMGNVVGKTDALLLSRKHVTSTSCQSRMTSLAPVLQNADPLLAAVGRDYVVSTNMVKHDATVNDSCVTVLVPEARNRWPRLY